MNMTRFVLFLPADLHKALERGAKRLKCSKAFYARILLETGEAAQKANRETTK